MTEEYGEEKPGARPRKFSAVHVLQHINIGEDGIIGRWDRE